MNGPITKPRNIEEESALTVASSSIFPGLGCPVVCHGLKNASRLKATREPRSVHEKNSEIRFAVHFEDKSIKPALIKPENLRIVVELPDEE